MEEEELVESKKRKRNLIINCVLLAVLLILIAVLLINKFVLTQMRVSGDSMQPTLENRQLVMVHLTKKVAKGDIVIFTHNDKMIVKRLIATAGDSVRIDEAGIVYVNGERLNDDYILDGRHNDTGEVLECEVGDGEYFLLGDNRCNSNDSHDYGVVSHDAIVGKII